VDNAGNSTLDYTLDKKQAKLWSLQLGTQFQLNKSWMIRAEYGFSSGRQQFFGGLQYRFGL
jgi:opacity protein-like surface antigen